MNNYDFCFKIGKLQKALDPHYSESHRFYHNSDHIGDMFETYDKHFLSFDLPNELLLAILFHDAVYIPGFEYNEEASVKLMGVINHTSTQYTSDTIKLASDLIMKTKISNYMNPVDMYRNGEILMDLDLCALSFQWDDFRKKQDLVVKEYCVFGTPEEIQQKQSDFLLKMLESKGKIYQTPEMQHLNPVAEENINRYYLEFHL